MIEEKLWKDQISHLKKKVLKLFGISSKIRHFVNNSFLVTLYKRLIYPYHTYCNNDWRSTFKTNLSKIFILRKMFYNNDLYQTRHAKCISVL